MILFATLAQLAVTPPAKVEIASASDCAILVEVGKSEVGWTAAGPTQPFVDVGPLRDGTIYRQACDWKALGVGAPTTIDPSQRGPRFAVEKPVYAADGQTAQVDINFSSWAGPGTHPFLSVRHCTLRKVADNWQLIQCRAGPIT